VATKPLIGLTCSVRQEDMRTPFYGVGAPYIRALEEAGGLPVLIPSNLDSETLHALYARLDGVVLIGGGDVDPAVYGLTAEEGIALRSVDQKRDTSEIALTRWALSDDKPLLGICRGVQVMNVALGGTLYQDLRMQTHSAVDHDLDGVGQRRIEGHSVTVAPDSTLAALLGGQSIAVNSMHHQAIATVAPDLTSVAVAPDGIVEGVERKGARFFIGVQWHPEELYPTSDAMKHLFEGFVSEAAKSH